MSQKYTTTVGSDGYSILIGATFRSGQTQVPQVALESGTMEVRLTRVDRLRQAMSIQPSDVTVVPKNTKAFQKYKIGDDLVVGSETMAITAVNPETYEITVTRPGGQSHKKNARIIHVLVDSPTSLTWDTAARQVSMMLEPDMTEFAGVYTLEFTFTYGGDIYVVTEDYSGGKLQLEVKS